MTDRRRWLALGFVLAAGAFFHGAVLLTQPIVPGPDAPSYIAPALELVQHHRFYAPGLVVYAYQLPHREPEPETFRTPGYPLFLAAILASRLPLDTAVWLQHLLGVALAAAVFLFADVVLHRRAAGVVAALLIATQPAILLLAHDYMAELLFTAVVAAALFCAHRALRNGSAAWAAAAGLLTGCAALIRPIALAFLLTIAVVVVLRARRAATAAFLSAALLLPLAWSARNYAVSGVATISSNSGELVLFFNAAGPLVVEDKPLLYRLSALQQSTGFYRPLEQLKPHLGDAAFAEMRAAGVDPRRAPHAILARYYARLGRQILLRHLPEAAELAVSAFVELFVYTYARPAASHEWLTLIAGIVLFAAACRGLAVLRRDDPACAFLFAATIAAFAIPVASAAADIRFAVPFAPAYAIAAGLGLTTRGPAATAAAGLHK